MVFISGLSTLEKVNLLTYILILSASDAKTEIHAAVWRLPSDFDTSSSDDSTTNIQPLELVCHLNSDEFGDMKR